MIDTMVFAAEVVEDVKLPSGRVVALRHANAGVYQLNVRVQRATLAAAEGRATPDDPTLEELLTAIGQVLPEATPEELRQLHPVMLPLLLAAACGRAAQVNDVITAWTAAEDAAHGPASGPTGKAPAPAAARRPRRRRSPTPSG
jgi:hypothetical protein